MAAVLGNGSLPHGSKKRYSSNSNSNSNSNSMPPPSPSSRSSRSSASNDTNAYMVYGHGSDNPGSNTPPYFTVPKGCYIVATSYIGSYGIMDQIPKNITALIALQKQFPDIITNPVKYISKLQHALPLIKDISQSIVIYGPHEKCPDFSYSLYDSSLFGGHLGIKCIDGPNLETPIKNLIPITYNELVDKRKGTAYYAKENNRLGPIVREIINDQLFENIPDLLPFNDIHIHICARYLYSIFPSIENVFYMIEHHILTIMREVHQENDDTDKDLDDYINANQRNLQMCSFNNNYVTEYLTKNLDTVVVDILDMLKTDNIQDTTVLQSKLCRITPGVYYNFACRVRYEKEYNKPLTVGAIEKILDGQYLKNIRSTVTRIKSPRLSPKTRKILTNRIAEAQKRKRIQRQLYNTNEHREKLKKHNIEHWRTTNSGRRELGEGIMQARITRKKATIAKKIQKLQAEQAAFPLNNVRRNQKISTRNKHIKMLMDQYKLLKKTSKQMKNNYHSFLRHYQTVSPNGNYVKLKSSKKWIPRANAITHGLTNANYNEPIPTSFARY